MRARPDVSAASPTARYLGLMERSLSPYHWADLMERRTSSGERIGIHAYSRIACVAAGLSRFGRLSEPLDDVYAMISACCGEIAAGERLATSDFAVKETLLAIEFIEDLAPPEIVAEWDRLLRQIEPSRTYRTVIRSSEDAELLHNINVYMLVGEYLRSRRGLTDVVELFDRHWPIQVEKFDAAGRYRDPGCPIVYDVATRVQIQHLLHSGYEGRYAHALDSQLRKAGVASLSMQAASGELAFGGRSNQFLFNEVLHAVSCEFEARRWAREGDDDLAGQFRSSARLAMDSIQRWLAMDPPRSLKNLWNPHTRHGTEPYGYYEKYMTSVGSFAALGLLFAENGPESAPPAVRGGHVTDTGPDFHQIVAVAGEYSLQIDTQANPRYDATGLGRLHRRGVPTELGLSVPCTGGDGYSLSAGCERLAVAIGPAWRTPSGAVHRLAAAGPGLQADLRVQQESQERVAFAVRYSGSDLGDDVVVQRYVLDSGGLEVAVEWLHPSGRDGQHPKWWIDVPVLVSNGHDETHSQLTARGLDVWLEGSRYRIETASAVSVGQERIGNRNGVYRVARVAAEGTTCQVRLSLEPPRREE